MVVCATCCFNHQVNLSRSSTCILCNIASRVFIAKEMAAAKVHLGFLTEGLVFKGLGKASKHRDVLLDLKTLPFYIKNLEGKWP